jgi:hypothetical protein
VTWKLVDCCKLVLSLNFAPRIVCARKPPVALTEYAKPVPMDEETPVVVPSVFVWPKPALLAFPGGAYKSDRM